MTKKHVVKIISFLLCCVLLVVALCDLFELEDSNTYIKHFNTYYKLDKGSIDAVLVGTSGIDRYYMPSLAWEEHGIATFPMTIDSFPAWMYIYVLEELRQYQDLELMVIDIRPFTQSSLTTDRQDVRARRVLDAMKLTSVNRLKAAFKAMDVVYDVDNNSSKFNLSYIFSFIKYHSKWKDNGFTVRKNIRKHNDEYAGFYANRKLSIKKIAQKPKFCDLSSEVELDKLSEESLYEVIDYVKENNIKALFIDTPQIANDIERGRSNIIYDILEENDLPVLHYYTEKTPHGISNIFNFDYENDFYNDSHLNYLGAQKFTKVLSDYLVKEYNLPDKRDNEGSKKFFEGAHERLLAKMAEYEAEEALYQASLQEKYGHLSKSKGNS